MPSWRWWCCCWRTSSLPDAGSRAWTAAARCRRRRRCAGSTNCRCCCWWRWCTWCWPSRSETCLLHEPAVADDDALAGQGVGFERGQRQRDVGHVVDGGELAVDGVLEHHVLHHFVLADAQLPGLFWDLLVDQRRAHEAGADHVGADAVLAAFLRHGAAQAE